LLEAARMARHSPLWPSAVALDEKDEEAPPTLRGLGPPASEAPTIAAPRHRRSLLLGAAFASAVATMFVLGWWQPSQHAPTLAPAAATSEPGRTVAHRAARTLAPSVVPMPRHRVAKSTPTHSAIPMPRPAAMTSAVASAYVPMEL
jgi:hypothetical protein